MNTVRFAGDALAKKSIEILLEHQSPYGSYIASPHFEQYQFAWFRDGAFCALAAFKSGEKQGAAKFNSWAAKTVIRHESLFAHALESLNKGEQISHVDAPPTRFNLDGSVETDHHTVWPNYQIDGYGSWLAIVSLTEAEPTTELLKAVRIVADFLVQAWKAPCYDCWEEGGEKIHGSTLLAVAGGLKAAFSLTKEYSYDIASKEIIREIETNFISNGHFIKNTNSSQVDASLAWAAIPHGAYEIDDPILLNTVNEIISTLRSPGGGIKRYTGDTYYGGGDWILLEALIAWNRAANGDRDFWNQSVEWIRSKADESGMLSEQILDNVQDPAMIKPWNELWGPNAHPLLWSHAMYLLLLNEGEIQGWL